MNRRVEQIQEMLLKEPDDAFLNYALALELSKNKEIQKAILILERVLQKDEHYLAGYYQLGKFYEQTGQKEKARDTYGKGSEIAKQQKNSKTLNELKEALVSL